MVRRHRIRRMLVPCLFAVAAMGPMASAPASAQTQNDGTFEDVAGQPGLSQRHADALRLYWAFFDRKPDPIGAQYWVDRVTACADLNNIAWSFANSTEFTNAYGNLSNDGFLNLIYANVLDRPPDPVGKAYWAERLSDGRQTRHQVMLNFSLGSEFRKSHPLPSDGMNDAPCTPPEPEPVSQVDACHPAYTRPCLPVTTDLDCPDIGQRVYLVDPADDPYRLDRDANGVGCESYT